MSYILEALKKSEAERQEVQPTSSPQQSEPEPQPEQAHAPEPDFADEPLAPPPFERLPLPVTTTPSRDIHPGWLLAGVLGLSTLALGVAHMVQNNAEPPTVRSIEKAVVAPNVSPPVQETATAKPQPAPPVTSTADAVRTEPPSPSPPPPPEPPATPQATTAQDIVKAPPVSSPELTVVDELPPEMQAQIQSGRKLALVTPTNQKDHATPRSSSDPVVITAPKTDPKTKTKAQKAKADAQQALRQVNAAWSAINRGHYKQAVRDLDTAVKLVPNNADAWFARGWAHEKSGKELTAIGDYARAIKAKPNHEFALFSRGYLNLYVGSPKDAVTDFVRASGVATDRAFKLYTQLWLYLSRARLSENGSASFSIDLEREDLNTWPGQLLRYFQGQLSEDGVLSAIERGTDAQVSEQRCTGYFFLGIQALKGGNTQKARSYFERALATGAVQFRQYDAAKRELERLNL